jgi:hypothetical protein
MRLDARNGDAGWLVWHVPTCRRMRGVVSVDSDLLEVETYIRPNQFINGVLATAYERFARIVVLDVAKVVLLDPVPDAELELREAATVGLNWG